MDLEASFSLLIKSIVIFNASFLFTHAFNAAVSVILCELSLPSLDEVAVAL